MILNDFIRRAGKAMPLALIILGFFSCSSGRKGTDSETTRAVAAQLNAYPASTLADIYKSFFQDEYGPGHLLEDPDAARRYLDAELAGMTSRKRYLAEPCGTGRNFVRVPLDLVKDSLIDPEIYYNAFLESAADFSVPDPRRWRKNWAEIVRVIENMDVAIDGFDQDRRHLDDLLRQGKPVVHHSDRYVGAYDPHYRIMTVEAWDRLKGHLSAAR